jgi:long-chain fatty acid transport protein
MDRNFVGGATALALIMAAAPALAGGYERSGQNIDRLFDEAQFVFDSRVTAVAPSFTYSRVTSPVLGSTTGQEVDLDYVLPRVDVKAGWGDADCLGSYSVPYGAAASYDPAWVGRLNVVEKELKDDQLALTCSYAFAAGPGALRVIAGLSYEMASYRQTKNFGLPVFPTLDVEGSGFGWRAGLGYEIPEYAVRATLMYYAPVDIHATGEITDLPGAPPVLPVFADATIPQSVELKLQSGVAPGWLVFGSAKWTDWSAWQRTDIKSVATGGVVTWLDSYFTDGWTLNLGVGHQFDEKLSGLVSVTWDQGVATGWTEHTDTWTLAAGVNYALTENLDLYGGVGATLITGGAVTKFTPGDPSTVLSEWDTNYSIGGQVGLKAHF